MGEPFAQAVDRLRHGGLVVYPTDTLFGLGADARNPRAVERLVALKGRSGSQPIAIAVSSYEEVEPLARLSPSARQFLRSRLPGPFTLLLPAARSAGPGRLAPPVRSTAGTVGIRLPSHPLARELARAVGPITATSANRHGEPPCRTVAEARRTFGDGVDVYLDGPPAPTGHPSTLVDWTPERGPRLHPR